MYDVGIQIVNYKTKRYLTDYLPSLFADLKESSLNYRVNILDNDSGDDLSDLEKKYTNDRITFYYHDKNVGFGAAHNILAKNTEAKYLLLLNPDIKFIEPQTVARLIARTESLKAQVVGPRLITSHGRTQRWDHGELHGLRATIALNAGHSFWQERTEICPAAWVSGAVFLIEKIWFDRLHGFDEHFFLYKEEEELCWRLREAGGTVFYDPTIAAFHEGSVVAKKSEHMRDSTDYFLEKHFSGKPGYSIFRLLNKFFWY